MARAVAASVAARSASWRAIATAFGIRRVGDTEHPNFGIAPAFTVVRGNNVPASR